MIARSWFRSRLRRAHCS